jgi:hypothetical protein
MNMNETMNQPQYVSFTKAVRFWLKFLIHQLLRIGRAISVMH